MLGFLAALVAGYLTPYAQKPLAEPLATAAKKHVRLEEGEIRLLAFIIVMLLAGIAAELLDSGSTFWVILGGSLGYFGTRLVAAAQSAMEKRR